jgi:competence protein ComEC
MAEFETIFVNVGQGDSTLFRLPGDEYMLVDVCRRQGDGIDLFKLLDDRLPEGEDGRLRLKYLVITHAHDDHICGIGDLYDRYEVEWLWLPQHEERKKIAKHFGDYQRVVDEHPEEKIKRPQGSRTPLEDSDADYDLGQDVSIRCFSPPGYIEIDETLSEEEAKAKVHENCLVLRVTYEGGTSVMLTGDSNLACWQRVVGYYNDDDDEETGTEVLSADVLSGSHHGSRTFYKPGDKDTEPWLEGLETIAPDLVVVSVGEDNDHGHPHEDMMNAYRDQCGTENVHETAQSGTVLIEVDSGGDYVLVLDPGSYAEDYAWDEEDDDDRGAAAKEALAGAAVIGGAALVTAGVKRHRDRRSRTRLDNQPAA